MEDILTPQVTAIASRYKPEVEKQSQEARIVAAEIKTAEDYQRASVVLRDLKDLGNHITEEFEPIRKELATLKQAVLDARDSLADPVKLVYDMLNGAMAEFTRLERIQIAAKQEAQRKAALEEEERQKKAAAKLLIKQGAPEMAKHILKSESHVGVPPIAETKADGISHREGRWKARVTNKMALVLAVKTNPELLNALEINTGWLNDMANRMKGNLKYPGVFTEKMPDTVTVR
jgi:hypothetical protein